MKNSCHRSIRLFCHFRAILS